MQLSLTRGALIPHLKSSAMSGICEEAAGEIAAALGHIPTHDREPRVEVETHAARLSAAASVTVIHPGAEAIEQKYGSLRKAGIAAGFKVK